MTASARVCVTIGDAKLEIEGEKAFVEKKLKDLLPLVAGGEEAIEQPRKQSSARQKAAAKPARKQTLKGYMEEKDPQNAYQAIAVVLHYKREHEEQPELEATEIRNGLRVGGYRPPGNVSQALVDCRRKYGYIDRGSARGMWRLVHQGEALVEFDLPGGVE